LGEQIQLIVRRFQKCLVMAEIDFKKEWHDTMLYLAADDRGLRNVIKLLLDLQGTDDEPESIHEDTARTTCQYYALNPDADHHEILELCVQKMEEESIDG